MEGHDENRQYEKGINEADNPSVEISSVCEHDWIEEWGGFKTSCRKCGYVDEEEMRRAIEWSQI